MNRVVTPTRQAGHLIVAAIRVLSHREERLPRPEEIAQLLEMPPAALRVDLAALHDLGIVAIVESAFDTQVEIRDYRLLEELAPEEQDGDLSADLAAFDQRKQEEADRMDRLFGEGDHERKQAERLRKMDSDLQEFRQRKPPNPFGDDD
jgi:hypothetical protein